MVMKNMLKLGVVLVLLVAVVYWFIHQAGDNTDTHTENVTDSKNAHKDDSTPAKKEVKKKKIKYWIAPMDPTYIRDKPGKSPMGMDLIPVYEDEEEESDKSTIKIDSVTVQNIGVRTTKASRGALHATIRTVGHVTYDEKRVEHIHTKISGWVEKLYVDTTGENVHKGQELLTIYSPELVSTQEEYLQALKYKKETSVSGFEDIVRGADTLIESTRRRLLLMDIDPEQIKALENRVEVRKDMLFRSPKSGIVIKKNAFEGMKVNPGMELYTIADLSRVWVIASVYEYELPFLKVGQTAEMTLAYEPGAIYKGRIMFIYPYLSAKTRTVQVRMEFVNPDLKLKPEMYANVVIKTNVSDNAILVPSEALLRTGSRNVVITSLGNGKFLPKEVTIGPEGEGFVQIVSGLNEGETVVTSGQFLIDSESNLREAINKMLEAKKTASTKKETIADKGREEMKMGEKIQKIDMKMSREQENRISELIDLYMRMHRALVSESVSEVAKEAQIMADVIKKIRAFDPEGRFKDFIHSVKKTKEGLLSEELEKQRASFANLSKLMVGYVKDTGREKALSAGIKVYLCPMNKEHWLQKGADIQNPYLGKDMLICGTEEKY